MKRFFNHLLTLVFAAGLASNINAQCIAASQFGTANFGPCSGTITATTCAFGGEYSVFNGLVTGQTYQFTGTGGGGNFLTVTTTANVVLASGFSPLNYTSTITGSIRLHVHTSATCGTDFSCHALAGNCTSCPPAGVQVCSAATAFGGGIQNGGTASINGSTVCSGVQAVATCGTTLNTAAGVWYSWTTGDCAGAVDLNTCTGTTYDSKLGVFRGNCNALVCVGGNDDACGLQSRVNFTAQPNTTYYIYVTGFASGTGAFTLTLNFTVDPCCSAPPLVASFSPSYIEVCPLEPFSGALNISGGIPGPPNGLGITNVSSAGFNGAAGGSIARVNGNNGSLNAVVGLTTTTPFRGGGAVVTNQPSTAAPNFNDPYYYVSTPNFYRWQNGVETLISANMPGNSACNAWDKTTNTMYVATAGFPGTLYRVDINTGALTTVGQFNGGGVSGFAIWVEISDDGQMYMFDIANDNVYRVNKANAACTLLGPAGFNANFGQDAWFWGDAVYSLAFNAGTFTTQYRKFDLTTGASTQIADYGFAQVGAQAWLGQTFPGGYAVNWNMTTGLTQTGANWSTFTGVLSTPGTYTYRVTVTDACGKTTTAELIVKVIDIPFAMACNDNLNIAVNSNCQVDIKADMFLEGPYDGCYDKMQVFIWPFGQEGAATGNVNNTSQSLPAGTHTYVVMNPFTGNKCWGSFTVEDKYAPTVTCQDITIACVETDLIEAYNPNGTLKANWLGKPTVSDNCGGATLIAPFSESTRGGLCDRAIVRTYGAVDAAGNLSAQCTQNITVRPLNFGEIFVPSATVEVGCGAATDPASLVAATGNLFDGYAVAIINNNQYAITAAVCNIVATYADQEIDACAPGCNGNKKVIRTWQWIDWCAADYAGPYVQLIKSVDKAGPTFILKDITVSTSPWYVAGPHGTCKADFDVPAPWELHDNCDTNPSYSVSGPGVVTITGSQAAGYKVQGAPLGVHSFCYTAADCCGNTTTNCMNVTVIDNTDPVPTTKQNIVVGLVSGGPGNDGNARLYTYHVDNGSYDNCSNVRLEVRRPAGAPQCGNNGVVTNGVAYNNNVTFNNNVPRPHADDNANDTDGGQYVTFCCQDLTTGIDIDGDGQANIGYHEVILRVWDDGDRNGIHGTAGDNYNESWAYVKVEDKAAPIITCPSAMTIHCDWPITLSSDLGSGAQSADGVDFTKTGVATGYGTCGLLPVRFRDNAQLNQCGIGSITRDFFVGSAPVNQAPSCRQNIAVLASTSTQQWVVTPPSSAKVSVSCDGPTEDQILANKPSWVQGPCDVIGYSTEVKRFDFEDGVCRKWIVQYDLMNWCTNEAKGPYFKEFVYSDTENPVLDACDPLMFGVDGSCSTIVTLNKTATDGGGCIDGGWLKWQVFVDLWADGTNDYEFSSFLAPGNDVANANNGRIDLIQDNNGNGVKDIYVAPTVNGGTVTIRIPEAIVGNMSNHKVHWKVTDGCHNHSACFQDFMVADKKAPTPYCVSLSTALMADPDGAGPQRPMVELWARDFNVGSFDNCTDSDKLLYTFDNWAPQVADKVVAGKVININTPHYFDATGGVMAYPTTNATILNRYNNGELQLWIPSQRSSAKVWTDAVFAPGTNKADVGVMMSVWDAKFNVDFCMVNLTVICNTCPTSGGSRVAGVVGTSAGQGVNAVTVTLNRNAPEFPIASTTNANGIYAFSNVTAGQVEIVANKGGDYMNGVSTFDLVLIQRHILGMQNLDNAYKVIAADVNNDAKINNIDLIQLRSLILGIKESFDNASWRFPVAGVGIDINNAFPYVETINVNVDGNKEGQNFVAVKIGDVTGDAKADVQNAVAESRTGDRINLTVAERSVEAGEVVSVPVTAANYNEVFGYQFTMNFSGAEFVDVIPGALEVNASNVGVIANDMITMSYAAAEAATVRDNEVLFTLVLKAAKAGQLSEMITLNSNITVAEAYAGNNIQVKNIGLTVTNANAVAEIELFQNEPNPFKGMTKVSFNMPKSDKAVLSVYDVTGRVIAVRNINAVQGMNTEVFTSEQLSASGVLYYKLESGDFTATKKMIIIE